MQKKVKICVFEVFISSIWRITKYLSCFKSLKSITNTNTQKIILFKYNLNTNTHVFDPKPVINTQAYTEVMKNYEVADKLKKLSTLTLHPIVLYCTTERVVKSMANTTNKLYAISGSLSVSSKLTRPFKDQLTVHHHWQGRETSLSNIDQRIFHKNTSMEC